MALLPGRPIVVNVCATRICAACICATCICATHICADATARHKSAIAKAKDTLIKPVQARVHAVWYR